MKTIWIIDHYSSEPKFGGIQRQFDFANELSKRGYKTIIISSAFSHFTHSYISKDVYHISQFADNAYYVYLRTKPYKTNESIGRAQNMFSFVNAVNKNSRLIEEKLGKPDVVIGASVHPLAWIAANKIAKHYGVKFIAEVRDFWPEAWLLEGEKKRFDPMVISFGMIEKWAYKRADKIIYSMFYGDKYLCGKLGIPKSKVALIGQPMDCERFDRNAEEKRNDVPEAIRAFAKDSFICVFTGYFMKYEGVHVMLKAAKHFQEKGVPIKFLFVGSGQEEGAMKSYVRENKLDNVLIHGRISKELIPAVLQSCDICLAHCATEGKEGNEELSKYGFSKNKVNEYLYSGNPVIFAQNNETDPVAKYGCGFVIKPFKEEGFVQRIREIYGMSPEKRAEFGKNGREYIAKYHRINSLVDKLLGVLRI